MFWSMAYEPGINVYNVNKPEINKIFHDNKTKTINEIFIQNLYYLK